MLSGVSRLDGGFPAYGPTYLNGPARASTIWSSLYPDTPGRSLPAQLEAHAALLESHSTDLRLVTTVDDMAAPRPANRCTAPFRGSRPPIDRARYPADCSGPSTRFGALGSAWNHETDYGFSCYDEADGTPEARRPGTGPTLDQSPILLDLAHLNDAGFFDALDTYARRSSSRTRSAER